MSNAVIFDLYGTLLQLARDSRPFERLARREASGNLRLAIHVALTTHNRTLADFATRIGLPPQDDIAELEAALNSDLDSVRPFEDTLPALEVLKRRGLKTAVISNLATPYKEPFGEHQLDELFDVTVFSFDCGLVKPAPEIYQFALERLGVAAHETMMVGDSFKSDVEGPSAVGIEGVHLVRSGERSRAETMIRTLDAVLDHAT